MDLELKGFMEIFENNKPKEYEYQQLGYHKEYQWLPAGSFHSTLSAKINVVRHLNQQGGSNVSLSEIRI